MIFHDFNYNAESMRVVPRENSRPLGAGFFIYIFASKELTTIGRYRGQTSQSHGAKQQDWNQGPGDDVKHT